MNEPTLNTWTIIFLFAAIQGIFLTVVLFASKSKINQANRYLGFFVLLFSLTLIDYFGFWSNYRFVFPHAFGYSFGFPFMFGPILYFYIQSLNDHKPQWQYQLFHFVPAVLFYAARTPYFLLSADEKLSLFAGTGSGVGNSVLIVAALKTLHMLVYAYLIQRSILSNQKNGSHKWQKVINGLFILFIISGATYYLLISTIDFKIEYDYMISLSMAFAIYSIGYLGYKNPEILHGFESKVKYGNSSLKPDEAERLLEALQRLLTEEKIYKQKDLKLAEVAQILGSSSHHLSQLVNEKLELSFPDLINSYRIEEIKTNLSDPDYQEHRILEIAYDSGFNNKANFNNAFRKFAHMSPSDYRKLHRLEYIN